MIQRKDIALGIAVPRGVDADLRSAGKQAVVRKAQYQPVFSREQAAVIILLRFCDRDAQPRQEGSIRNFCAVKFPCLLYTSALRIVWGDDDYIRSLPS